MTTLMTTSRMALGGALALALAPALWPGDAAAHTCDAPFTTDLITGTGIDVGEVKVCNDAEFLTITYETAFPWCVLRTHLHVASDLAGIPQTFLGTPRWGQFEFSEEVGCETPAPLDIPLAEIAGGVVPGETVTIAARAVVEGEGPDGTHPQCLLGDKCVAWGEGPRFRPRLPATYFTYEVQEALLCGDAASKCVFVTSSTHDGSLGGLDGGDAICNARAAEAGLPGAYEAWLSIGETGNSAAERLNQAAVPYKLVDGSTVANDFADLTTCDGSGGACLQHPIDLTETGAGPVDAEVWTATGVTGMREGGDCGGWDMSDEEDVLGSFGLSSAVDANWTLVSNGEAPCSEDRRLYCFQQ